MLAGTALTPLLANLQNMTLKSNAGGGNKDCVTWEVEEVVQNFVHADKVTTDSSADKGKKLEGCLVWDVAQPLHKLHRKFLNIF